MDANLVVTGGDPTVNGKGITRNSVQVPATYTIVRLLSFVARALGGPHGETSVLTVGSGTSAPGSLLRYIQAAAACAIPTFVALVVPSSFDLSNVVMLFLLTVFLVAVALGRGPSLLATFLSVASFDFFFVPPRFSFEVNDMQYVLTFAVMLVVGLVTSQLAAGLRYQARIASQREEQSRALYEFARDLSSPLRREDIVAKTVEFIGRTFRAEVALLLPGDMDVLVCAPSTALALPVDVAAAQYAFDSSQLAGAGTDIVPDSPCLYLPLRAPTRTGGVLVVRPDGASWLSNPEQRRYLETFAALVAIALERVHYVEMTQSALISSESERLRNSLLSALSHDLRTPLAVLLSVAESIRMTRPPLSQQQLDKVGAICEAAHNMTRQVNNLLDMARIQSGEVKLNLQWQPFEEIVGSALRAMRSVFANHHVEVDLGKALPLVEFDAVLIERVLYNLLENAAKYTKPGTTVRIRARACADKLLVSVCDEGPGLPPGQEGQIFEKFTRGERDSAISGVGLGLSICRAIIEAHHEKIWAQNNPERGATFFFTLPLGMPPELPESIRGMVNSDGQS